MSNPVNFESDGLSENNEIFDNSMNNDDETVTSDSSDENLG
jgi:hypothetical protein